MKFLRSFLLIALVLSTAPQVLAREASAVQLSPLSFTQQRAEKEVQQAFDAWIAAVSRGSSDDIVKLYTQDAVLLATLSPVVRDTPALRKDYFDEFTAKQDLKGVVNEAHIRVFGNVAVNSGLYTFTYTKDGETIEVPARFSFVYRKSPQGWLIVDHHSSRRPVAP